MLSVLNRHLLVQSHLQKQMNDEWNLFHIKKSERDQWRVSDVYIVNFEQTWNGPGVSFVDFEQVGNGWIVILDWFIHADKT